RARSRAARALPARAGRTSPGRTVSPPLSAAAAPAAPARGKRRAAQPLSPVLDARVLQVLAALLLLAQAPQVLRLPIWLSCLGIGLVLGRIALLKRGLPMPPSLWL